MPHDIFISYSSKDKAIADGICANLETAGLRCWIAPRDIAAGEDWPTAITSAISHSMVMVLVFSSSSNASEEVGREIILAAKYKLVIIPFMIENIEPEMGKQYYLARTHWLEAMNPPTREQIQKLVARVQSIIPPLGTIALAQPAPGPLPAIVQPLPLPPQIKRSWFSRNYLWIGMALVLITLALIFWPKFQGLLASQKATPTLAATVTLTPTLTPTPSATPTEMYLPSATPSTGTVTGSVVWGINPYEGVTVTLCSDWSIACNGQEYSAVTDAQGGFSISGIEPGEYQLVTFVPDQLGIFYPGDKTIKFQVNAGETIDLEPVSKCKYDLNVSSPVINNGRISLRWNAYPGAVHYSINIIDVYWNNVDFLSTNNLSGTTENNLLPGNYYYQVDVDVEGQLCARGFGRLTIP